VGCSGDSDGEPESRDQTAVGIIAIGHSGLTGNNADPARPEEDTKEFSWATGAVPEVNSIYQRLMAIRPETEGHVFNAAVGGAVSDTLAEQAGVAPSAVPAPALVIVQTIDNDIRCDGTDADRVDDFGDNVAGALRVITESSPRSRIVMVSSFGRPDPGIISTIIAAHPDLKPLVTGSGVCDFYNPAGELVPESFAALISILEGFEAEQARVCAAVPQCSTDGGAATRFEDTIDDYSDDYIHLNVGGLARLAEHLWPVIAAQLESP
jgi:lysophospholipase L1-like esterase